MQIEDNDRYKKEEAMKSLKLELQYQAHLLSCVLYDMKAHSEKQFHEIIDHQVRLVLGEINAKYQPPAKAKELGLTSMSTFIFKESNEQKGKAFLSDFLLNPNVFKGSPYCFRLCPDCRRMSIDPLERDPYIDEFLPPHKCRWVLESPQDGVDEMELESDSSPSPKPQSPDEATHDHTSDEIKRIRELLEQNNDDDLALECPTCKQFFDINTYWDHTLR